MQIAEIAKFAKSEVPVFQDLLRQMMEKTIRWLENVGLAIAGACIIVMMLVTSADAVLRYTINSPLAWASELISYYLLIAAAYLSVSSTFRHGDHINIDLIKRLMSKRTSVVLEIVCGLGSALLFGAIAYAAGESWIEAVVNREYLPGYVPWPAWVSYLFILIGSIILIARILHHIFTLMKDGFDPYVKSDANHEGQAE